MKWNRVEDWLPEDDVSVLVKFGPDSMRLKKYGVAKFRSSYGWSESPVLAWTPFEPYDENAGVATFESDKFDVEQTKPSEAEPHPEPAEPTLFEDMRKLNESGKGNWFSKWFCPGE